MKVCVVGLGKLGACMAAVFADVGHQVIGVDVDAQIVQQVNDGAAPVSERGLIELMFQCRTNIRATTSMGKGVRDSDIAFVIVPTPSEEDGRFSNLYVLEVVRAIGTALKDSTKPYTVVISSTVTPGSCDGPISSELEAASGRSDIGLCYSPEFIALGSVIQDLTHPDLVLLGGKDDKSVRALHEAVAPVVRNSPAWQRMSLIDAEVAKIAVNAYVTMKISFANTLGEICQRLPGGNADLVTQAIGHDTRIGHRYLKPGAGYGGPCFPRDNSAFAAVAHQVGTSAELALATDVVNRRQVLLLADEIISSRVNPVSVLGIAYKPHTSVIECSFGLELVKLLQFEGIKVHTFDPRANQSINGNEQSASAQECVRGTGLVVIANPDPAFINLDFRDKTVIDMWGVIPDDTACTRLRRFGRAA